MMFVIFSVLVITTTDVCAQSKVFCGKTIPTGYIETSLNSNGCRIIMNISTAKPGTRVTICSSILVPPIGWAFVEDDSFIPCNTINGRKLYRRVIQKLAGLPAGFELYICTKYGIPAGYALKDISPTPCQTVPFGAKYYRMKIVNMIGYKPGTEITILSATPTGWFTLGISKYFINPSYYQRRIILLQGTPKGFTFVACSGDKIPTGFVLQYTGSQCDYTFGFKMRYFIKAANLQNDEVIESRSSSTNNFPLFPNPSRTEFIIKRSTGDMSNYSIKIFNVLGQSCEPTLNWSGGDPDIQIGEGLPPGNYWVHINNVADGSNRIIKAVKIE